MSAWTPISDPPEDDADGAWMLGLTRGGVIADAYSIIFFDSGIPVVVNKLTSDGTEVTHWCPIPSTEEVW